MYLGIGKPLSFILLPLLLLFIFRSALAVNPVSAKAGYGYVITDHKLDLSVNIQAGRLLSFGRGCRKWLLRKGGIQAASHYDRIQWYISGGKYVVGITDNRCLIQTENYCYTPYGSNQNLYKGAEIRVSGSSANQQSKIKDLTFDINNNPFKYDSYYFDVLSGMHYLNARYYTPEFMRFTSRDSYDLPNRYAYCNANPVLQSDPKGHMPGSISNLLLLGLDALTDGGATGAELGAETVLQALAESASDVEIESCHMSVAEFRGAMFAERAPDARGGFGNVYFGDGYAYKFENNIPGMAVRTPTENARLINFINGDTTFRASVVRCTDGEILKTPICDPAGESSLEARIAFVKGLETKCGRIMLDPWHQNFGYYEGKLVCFDVDHVVTLDNIPRSPASEAAMQVYDSRFVGGAKGRIHAIKTGKDFDRLPPQLSEIMAGSRAKALDDLPRPAPRAYEIETQFTMEL